MGGLSDLTIGNQQIINPSIKPGIAETSKQNWESGGTFEFEINDPNGRAGVNWDLLKITGELDISALSKDKQFVIKPITLTTGNASGELEDFNKEEQYQWEIVSFGSITDNFSPSLFSVDTGSFANEFIEDKFEISMKDNKLYLNYMPPLPGTLFFIN